MFEVSELSYIPFLCAADNLVSSSDNNELEGNCTGLVAARFSKSHIIVNVTEKRGRKNSTTKKNAWH